ncbi:MAG TPA: single-stranded DNA-binding protein [Candidatus Paceibacterota bacterium]|nr:single-stranded DNA-binding protein [Candidatus Paceibacterota bacterium]
MSRKSKTSGAPCARSNGLATGAAVRGRDADPARALVLAARRLRQRVARLQFAPPVWCVYNPLDYAWASHELYLRRYGCGRRRVVFLGMNPGPFGMAQTGVPFGEVRAVRDWLGIEAPVRKPPLEHPRRPVLGFDCLRTEVSGQRLWGLFASRFGTPHEFFRNHLVVNYCPLAFLESSGRNRTPDKLPSAEKAALTAACDEHLRRVVEILQPEWLIGIGDFAWRQALALFSKAGPRLGRILHPSPANPAANRDWAAQATRQLQELGVWS